MTNRGKLILDASCAPADISYPTDLELLNQSRKHTETFIATGRIDLGVKKEGLESVVRHWVDHLKKR